MTRDLLLNIYAMNNMSGKWSMYGCGGAAQRVERMNIEWHSSRCGAGDKPHTGNKYALLI